jgi:hypothetical protein
MYGNMQMLQVFLQMLKPQNKKRNVAKISHFSQFVNAYKGYQGVTLNRF